MGEIVVRIGAAAAPWRFLPRPLLRLRLDAGPRGVDNAGLIPPPSPSR